MVIHVYAHVFVTLKQVFKNPTKSLLHLEPSALNSILLGYGSVTLNRPFRVRFRACVWVRFRALLLFFGLTISSFDFRLRTGFYDRTWHPY